MTLRYLSPKPIGLLHKGEAIKTTLNCEKHFDTVAEYIVINTVKNEA